MNGICFAACKSIVPAGTWVPGQGFGGRAMESPKRPVERNRCCVLQERWIYGVLMPNSYTTDLGGFSMPSLRKGRVHLLFAVLTTASALTAGLYAQWGAQTAATQPSGLLRGPLTQVFNNGLVQGQTTKGTRVVRLRAGNPMERQNRIEPSVPVHL
jgi:hypothetical protein